MITRTFVKLNEYPSREYDKKVISYVSNEPSK